MGFIRGTAITFFSIVLLISLFLMNFSLIVSWSLEHDTLQPALKISANDFLKDSLNVNSMLGGETKSIMQSYCLVNSEYSFTYGTYKITIPCNVIKEGSDSIINYSLDSLIDTIYYAKYNCEFWKCVKDSSANSSLPFVLFSEKAMDYWRNNFILLAAISIVLFALIFLLSTKKPITVIIAGILIILSALPFRKLGWALHFIPAKFSGIFSVFFTKSYSVFIIMTIIGFIFIGIGLAFKFFGLSMNFANFLSRDSGKEEISKSEVREIVDEEISKKNKLKKKRK
jgi:hypothetical protein